MQKCLGTNDIATALLPNKGPFYDISEHFIADIDASAHDYAPTEALTLNEFLRSRHVKNDSFNRSEQLPNFKSARVDPQRLFLLARRSKTFLQARMLQETLARNVFLLKNEPLFPKNTSN